MTGYEKAIKIRDDYITREYREQDLANKYQISVNDIQKALKLLNCEHTIVKNESNLKDGQTYYPITIESDFDFLDKYGDELFK